MSTLVTPTVSLADQVMACVVLTVQVSPPLGAVTVTFGGVVSGGLMVKAALDTSKPLLPAASYAITFTNALLDGVLGMIQLYEPVLAMPVAIGLKVPAEPSVAYRMSTDVTLTLSVAVHLINCVESAVQFSLPLGAVTVAVGAVMSGPVGPSVRLLMKVPQLARESTGVLAYSLAAQKVPSLGSIVMPL